MKKNKNNGNMAKLISIYFICFLFISIAYSFLSTKLELTGKAGFSEDAIRQFKYDYDLTSSWKQGNFYYYNFTVNFTYLGFNNINGWQVNISVPTNTEVTGCFDSGGCTIEDSILRIINATWNGSVNYENQTFSTSFIIKTTKRNYELSVLSVNFYENGEITNPVVPDPDPVDPPVDPDNPDPVDPPVDPDVPVVPDKIKGIVPNLSTKNYWGNITQMDLVIKNNSEIDLISWELKYTVPVGSTIANIWGANYVITDDTLTLSGVSWTSEIVAGGQSGNAGLQLKTSTPAPAVVTLQSFTGVNADLEDVEMEI